MSTPNPEPTQYEANGSPDIPVTMDKRPPQLNEVVCRCRIGCACATSRGGGEGGSDGGGHLAQEGWMLAESADEGGSDHGGSVNGDEGPAEHKIEVGDFGFYTVQTIQLALTKHQRCTCRCGILPDIEEYPFSALNSPSASGILSGDSMIVELSGGELSMSSSLVQSTGSGSYQSSASGRLSPNDYLDQMGEHFTFEAPHVHTPPPSLFNGPPIWLGHERGYCFNMSIGNIQALHYPPELSMGDSASSTDHSEYGM